MEASREGGQEVEVAANEPVGELPEEEEEEAWEEVAPHVEDWLWRSEVAPEVDLLSTYARKLVEALRLDDLACFVHLVGRVARERMDGGDSAGGDDADGGWHQLLAAVVEVVDGLVVERYGVRFEPLDGLRELCH